MTDFATNPSTTVATDALYLVTAVAFSLALQAGVDFSANHAATAIPGALPRPLVGLVWPRVTV